MTRQRKRFSIRDEGGQSLVVIVLAMSMLLAMAAFAIDISQWYTARHQAQVTADSAALAAANCLAFPGNGPAPQCTSPGIDQTDAKAVAVAYSQNGVTVSSGNVAIDTTNYTVTVTANVTAGSGFASLFGIGARNISATAVASFTAQPTSCSGAGAACDFMFADDSNCSNPNAGITIDKTSGDVTITGNIQTNGNLNVSSNGNVTLGTGQYGPGTSCTGPHSSKGWSETPAPELATTSYPIDYTKDFPACTGTGCYTTGVLAGYPTFCTEASTLTTGWSISPSSGNIYCASGSGSKSDPSSWNGSITVSSSSTGFDTFVGGDISYDIKNGNLSACGFQQPPSTYTANNCNSSVPTPATGNYPLFYATDATSTAVNLLGSGNGTISGDIFAPNGTVAIGSVTGTPTLITFIEGYDIVVQKIAGTVTGDGPAAGSSGTGGPPGDSLTQ
ncbi:MAG TPA: pilus assembly protein TadG-related protein [Acidothermaceae bacterium]|nr:pilus assembly protein TadG-related protein [Acidothermaceae bacterium]